MKTLIITLVIFSLALGVNSQETKKDSLSRKEIRALKRQKRDAELKILYDSTSQIIDNKEFVLQADYLDNMRGHRINVLSSLNFIKVDSDYSVIQIGSNRGLGYNGVGGITAEGKITNWKMDKNDKNKSFFISMSVLTNIGIYDVFMDINADGAANAVVSGLRPGRLKYDGQIVPIEESSVYQGHTP